MTKTLGIDYGKSKIGLALGIDRFAEPMSVIRFNDIKIACDQIVKIISKENISKLVVGVSEGKMGQESKKFAETLQSLVDLSVELHDETLSSKDAQRLSIEAGINRKKRKQMEDAYAAAIMLQGYLDRVKT